ncbi:MAG: hypothetical protein NTY61_01885 [Candidatus Parcubacteria bacterium]|nr:hypothetical protein [Candidatus Parcubacteria bacterium]
MIFKKIPLFINRFFGILILLIFIGIFPIILIFPRFIIQGHTFNSLPILVTLLFFSFLAMFILKPFLKDKSPLKTQYSAGLGFWVVTLFITAFVLLFGYFSICIPMSSQFLGEIDLRTQSTIQINAKNSKEIYFEFDTGSYTANGTQIKVIITGPNNWSANKTYTIAKKDGSSNRGTTISTITIFGMAKIPADGEYNIVFNQLDNQIQIKEVRIFEK